jgi:hypothetical protein
LSAWPFDGITLSRSGYFCGGRLFDQQDVQRKCLKAQTTNKENSMTNAKTAALITLAMLMAVPGVQAACTKASVAGKFGFTTSGTIPALGAVAATGVFSQNASGSIVGSQTRSLNGDIADETFTGTATVNPDCTGTDTIQVFQDGSPVRTSTLHVVYDDNGREARAIFTSLVLENGATLPSILTIEARKMFVKD